MVVAEHGSAVARPDVVPDVLRVDANAVNKPLGVVVERDLKTLVSTVCINPACTYVDFVRSAFRTATYNCI